MMQFMASIFDNRGHITKGSLTTRRHAIYAQGQAVALYITHSNNDNDVRYLLRDHLGSVDVITRQSGEVVERLAYDLGQAPLIQRRGGVRFIDLHGAGARLYRSRASG